MSFKTLIKYEDILCKKNLKNLVSIKSEQVFGSPFSMYTYSNEVHNFMKDVDNIIPEYPEYDLANYSNILSKNKISMIDLKPDTAWKYDLETTLAILVCIVKSEDRCEGIIEDMIRRNIILDLLERLEDFDKQK